MTGWRLLGIGICLALLIGAGGAAGAGGRQQAAGVGCTNLDTAYDPDCDVDRSGRIDVQDLTLVAFHWGQEGVWTGPTGDGWSLTGNAGTDPATNFLGTTDDVAIEIRVNNQRALRIEPAADATFGFSPNLIGGYSGNGLGSGVLGATIAGGGRSSAANQVTADFGTIGGGEANTASSRAATVSGGQTNRASGFGATVAGGSNNVAGSGQYATVSGGIANVASGEHAAVGGGISSSASGTRATVPGGFENAADGNYSFAAGRQATVAATHHGTFLFADSSPFDFDSEAAREFAVRATGGARFVSAIDGTGNPSAGVRLAPGASAWSVLSAREAKANFVPVDGTDVLARLAAIPIQTWNYKSQDPSIRHIGPMAQDFYAAFGVGEDDRHISTVDADGVALAAIQGLYQLVKAQEAQIAALQRQNADLEARLAALEQAIKVNDVPASAGRRRSTVPWPRSPVPRTVGDRGAGCSQPCDGRGRRRRPGSP